MGALVKVLAPGDHGFEPTSLGEALLHASLLGVGDVVSERRALAKAEGRKHKVVPRKWKGPR